MTDQTYQDLSVLDYWYLPLADMANAAGAPSRYLRSSGALFLSTDRPGEEPVASFCYDAADPVAETLALDCWSLAWQMGGRRAIRQRQDVLVQWRSQMSPTTAAPTSSRMASCVADSATESNTRR